MGSENGHAGSVLWAWIGEEKGEVGVARLQKAWLPLGTINLVAFSKGVLTDPHLVQALQTQADKDGQTVRLVKFVRAGEVLSVGPGVAPTPLSGPLRFWKYHALGNDYLVVEGREWAERLHPPSVRRICDRHFGVGSDGILVHQPPQSPETFSLRILNPDGSEAEKSGNGLRIFARYLWDSGLVSTSPFQVATRGGVVLCEVMEGGRSVTVEMGVVRFTSRDIPVCGPEREVIEEPLEVEGRSLCFTAATVGNPHCVLIRDRVSEEEAKSLGPLIENDARFPNRTNVQFVQVLDRHNLRVEIWERGAGYTLASGSSSCAAAAVARRLGLCDSPVTVHMPGGSLVIEVGDDYAARMSGPVTKVGEGVLSPECLDA